MLASGDNVTTNALKNNNPKINDPHFHVFAGYSGVSIISQSPFYRG
jgi:hypothetical protein